MDPLNEKGDGPGARRPGAGGLGRSEPDGKDGLGDSAQDRFYIPPDSSPIAKNPGKAEVRRMQKRREKRLRAERRERDALREQSRRRSSEEYLRVREAIKEEQRRDEQRTGSRRAASGGDPGALGVRGWLGLPAKAARSRDASGAPRRPLFGRPEPKGDSGDSGRRVGLSEANDKARGRAGRLPWLKRLTAQGSMPAYRLFGAANDEITEGEEKKIDCNEPLFFFAFIAALLFAAAALYVSFWGWGREAMGLNDGLPRRDVGQERRTFLADSSKRGLLTDARGEMLTLDRPTNDIVIDDYQVDRSADDALRQYLRGRLDPAADLDRDAKLDGLYRQGRFVQIKAEELARQMGRLKDLRQREKASGLAGPESKYGRVSERASDPAYLKASLTSEGSRPFADSDLAQWGLRRAGAIKALGLQGLKVEPGSMTELYRKSRVFAKKAKMRATLSPELLPDFDEKERLAQEAAGLSPAQKAQLAAAVGRARAGHAAKIEMLAAAVGAPVELLSARFDRSRYSGKGEKRLATDAPTSVGQAAMGLGLAGLKVRGSAVREYPAERSMFQIVGGTKRDEIKGEPNTGNECLKTKNVLVGVANLEYKLNSALNGVDGCQMVARDKNGGVQKTLYSRYNAPVSNGKNIALTIDRNMQEYAFDALKAAVGRFEARYGSMVVLDPATGDILAMASYPSRSLYDPVRPECVEAQRRFEEETAKALAKAKARGQTPRTPSFPAACADTAPRAAAVGYEPGSIIKPIWVAKAIDMGKVTPATRIDLSPYRFGDYVRSSKAGSRTVTDVIVWSDNVGAMRIADMIPDPDFLEYQKELGFGAAPKSGASGEFAGILHTGKTIGGKRGNVGMGYSISLSLLQITRAYTAIANDGILAEVSLIKRPEGMAPAGKRVFKAETARKMREILRQTVERGTAMRAKIDGVPTAGKTGTATARADYGAGYKENGLNNASFVGMFPASKPKYLIGVMIAEPNPSMARMGGAVAAPVMKDMGDFLVNYDLRSAEPLPQ